MPHELNYRQVDVPELDAFIAEYDALCRKHGMQFVIGDYDYDGGSYATIGVADDSDDIGFILNLDKAGDDVECIARAREQIYAMQNAEERAEQEKRTRVQAEAPADPVLALEGLLKHMPSGYWSDELFAAKAAAEKALVKLKE